MCEITGKRCVHGQDFSLHKVKGKEFVKLGVSFFVQIRLSERVMLWDDLRNNYSYKIHNLAFYSFITISHSRPNAEGTKLGLGSETMTSKISLHRDNTEVGYSSCNDFKFGLLQKSFLFFFLFLFCFVLFVCCCFCLFVCFLLFLFFLPRIRHIKLGNRHHAYISICLQDSLNNDILLNSLS